MGKDFFRGNNFNRPNNVRNEQFSQKHNNQPVDEEVKEVNRPVTDEVKEVVEEVKEVDDFKKTNYLELDKKEKENLNFNGVLFKHGTVANCNVLNFRLEPKKGAKIIGTFNFGENILYSETNDPEWFMLKNKEGKIGYCMSEFIKIEI